MLSFTGCVVILFGLVGLYGYNNAFRNFYDMEIRKYKQSDCKELAKLFYHTVHTVNAKDYKVIKEQQVVRQGISLTNFIMEKCR